MSGAKTGDMSGGRSAGSLQSTAEGTFDLCAAEVQLAVDRATSRFAADHTNAQAYSKSRANLDIYLAFLKPGDKVMGRALPMGGHDNRVPFATKKFSATGIG